MVQRQQHATFLFVRDIFMQENDFNTPHLRQIINGCKKQERAAQETLYRLFSHKMMGVCMWYAKNKVEAEEILQDGFMRVFTYIGTYKEEGTLESWMRRIMVNAALRNYQTKKQNAYTIEYNAPVHDKPDTNSVLNGLNEKDLMKLVQSLSPAYRMVFSLYVLEGLKHKEIAAQLGISENTSKTNLADARAILRKRISLQSKSSLG